ncbi:carbohydrate kinase family protein [Rugosimonospora africana]|uniref:Ribokinase n=1 Tax=Rugosimonospora africana TaxID=556532 RepID=A0A8J3QSA2_9ACTN|nr:PfkB family carbohydrate kinase [Rugosimonospora africana]GIH16575.1 ribokinase [Rugosimonospora africana]
MSLDVICVGTVTLDTIAVARRLPSGDDRVVAEPFVVAGGGPAATAAVALARLGASVGFCGVVGDDEAGQRSRQLLADEGVDVRWLRTRRGARTAQSMVVVSETEGTRMIITSPSAPLDPDAVPVSASRWLHVDQAGYPAARAALSGRSDEVRLSIDGGNPIPGLDLGHATLYAPTTRTLREAFPATDLAGSLRAAAAAGAQNVVATDGANGSYVLVDGAAVHVPAPAVEPLSTMGAGDVFHGALLAALLGGQTLVEATRWANAVAAVSCRALDGRSGIADFAEAGRYLSAALPAPRAEHA